MTTETAKKAPIATARELAEQCHTLGLTCTEDALDCLGQIERIFSNFAESPERKARARACLQVVIAAGDGDAAFREALRLLHAYPAEQSRPRPRPPEPWKDLVSPQDPGWIEWIERLAQEDDRDNIRTFSRHLSGIFHNALHNVSGELSEEETFLNGKPAIEAALSQLLDSMDMPTRLRLEEWRERIVEIEERTRAAEVMARLQTAHDQGNWGELKELLSRTAGLLLSDEQQKSIGRMDEEATEYHRWHDEFIRTLKIIENFTSEDGSPLPWPWPIEIARQHQMEKGLERWGTEDEQARCARALDDVIVSAGQFLVKQETVPERRLDVLHKVRETWREATRERQPIPAAWTGLLTATQQELDNRFRNRAAQVRAGFRMGEDWTGIGAPAHLSPAAREEYNTLLGELESLKGLDTRLGIWEREAEVSLIDSEPFRAFQIDLDALALKWEQAPGFREIRQRFAGLTEALKRVAEARECLIRGDSRELEQALRILETVNLPLAEGELRNAKTLLQDIHLTNRIRAGEIAEISEADLARAGPGVQRLYDEARACRDLLAACRDALKAFDPALPFETYTKEILALRKSLEASTLQCSHPDQDRRTRLQDELLDVISKRAAKDIAHLGRRCHPYPLIPSELLAELRFEQDALQRTLALPTLEDAGGRELLRNLNRPGIILSVHALCHKCEWEEAESLSRKMPATPLPGFSGDAHRGLLATIAATRLRFEKGSDEEWLKLFAAQPDILLQRHADQKRYLALLRDCEVSTMPHLAGHIRVLEERFPALVFLRGMVRVALDPLAAAPELTHGQPMNEDLAFLRRVLERAVAECISNEAIRQLWDRLDQGQRQLVWPQPVDPFELQRQRFDKQRKKFQEQMLDSRYPLHKIRTDLRELSGKCAVVLRGDGLLGELDIAVELESEMQTLSQKDPWAPETIEQIRLCQGLLGRLNVKFAGLGEARGWRRSLEAYDRGGQAWNQLESHWSLFRANFDRLDTLFHAHVKAWSGFMERVDRWCDQLAAAVNYIDWSLPGVETSARWTRLMAAWRESREGVLWRTAMGDEPRNIDGLQHCYRQLRDDMRDFSTLHEELLMRIPRYISDPDDALLAELTDPLSRLAKWRPLSHPVQEIRRFLMDSDVTNVGAVHAIWATRGETNETAKSR
uniref:Uncharacterized protein n=1 Tax=Candidatus Kentrum sp. MB TaxID=2138164 RepID=A0A451BAW3_9GAMM|nr:MAG: hypothetical protein BECKMB1821I_GA0114274_10227 [Candidatus Kentron sp. MB]VFK75431.1 MAG: hypothetical protein BECKMB1821H_GA0114242_10227 [Candidatus Kentron sp. MB]